MPRYFLEVAYKGTQYSGFQIQQNANTIQAEVEKALNVLFGLSKFSSPGGEGSGVKLTGSSRTDAGVHALQNYFHFDYDGLVHPHVVYKMNALLPPDIVLKNIHTMTATAHCRFDAVSRAYEYRIYKTKNPFLRDTAFYYPYKLNTPWLHETAAIIKEQTDFFAFAKTNSDSKNYRCSVYSSEWLIDDEMMLFRIEANRFLRGMVRLLTGMQLNVAKGKFSIEQFSCFFRNTEKCGRAAPAAGLFLKAVNYPNDYFPSAFLSQNF